ncbi:hypothetical protein D3C87_1549350 [compost metagenome]
MTLRPAFVQGFNNVSTSQRVLAGRPEAFGNIELMSAASGGRGRGHSILRLDNPSKNIIVIFYSRPGGVARQIGAIKYVPLVKSGAFPPGAKSNDRARRISMTNNIRGLGVAGHDNRAAIRPRQTV